MGRRLFTVLGAAAALGSMVVGGSGCASVVRGSNQQIAVKSTPASAKVTVYDDENHVVDEETTPCTLSLRRGHAYFKSNSYKIVVERPGYSPHTTYVKASVNGWYIVGNAVIGGLIGYLAVDPVTGAMYHLTPDDITVTLSGARAMGSPTAIAR